MIVVHTNAKLKDGSADAVKAFVEGSVPAITKKIDGFIRSFYTVTEDGSEFNAFGVFEDAGKFKKFVDAGGMKEAMGPMMEHLAGPPSQTINPVFFGWTAEQNG